MDGITRIEWQSCTVVDRSVPSSVGMYPDVGMSFFTPV